MRGITTYSKTPVRFMELIGVILSIGSFLLGVIGVVLCFFNIFLMNIFTYLLLMIILFFQGICLFCIGMIGEYILCINIRQMNQPIVIEEERINF